MAGPASPHTVIAGAGRLGSAIIQGWLRSSRSGVTPDTLTILDPRPAGEVETLISEHGLTQVETLNEASARAADVLVLAVKPNIIDEVLQPIAETLRDDTLIISVAAGTTLSDIARHGANRPIVRIMTNVAGQIGKGVSVAIGNEHVTSNHSKVVERLMKVLGPIYWIKDERQMGAVTAVSGSGPAYVFLLCEALARAGEAEGLPADLAEKLAVATVAGSGTLLERAVRNETGDAPSLRRSVTSPGGTTQAALDVLMGEGGLPTLIRNAVAAAERRSRQLSGGGR